MNFNKGGKGLCLPHVETLHPSSIKRDSTSLRKKRLKYTTVVQRGEEGIPRSIAISRRIGVRVSCVPSIKKRTRATRSRQRGGIPHGAKGELSFDKK